MKKCNHLDEIRGVTPSAKGCEECLKTGGWCSSGGLDAGGEWSIQFPRYAGIKCYAIVSGQCWLLVEDNPDPVLFADRVFIFGCERPEVDSC